MSFKAAKIGSVVFSTNYCTSLYASMSLNVAAFSCGRVGHSQGSWMTFTRLPRKPKTHWQFLKPLNSEAADTMKSMMMKSRMMKSTQTVSKWTSRGTFKTCPRAFSVISRHPNPYQTISTIRMQQASFHKTSSGQVDKFVISFSSNPCSSFWCFPAMRIKRFGTYMTAQATFTALIPSIFA